MRRSKALKPAARQRAAQPSQMLSELLPTGVAAAEYHGPGDAALLMPEELACLRQTGSRQPQLFAAGRLCARQALAQLGIYNYPLSRCSDGRPGWPQHLTGSITHIHNYGAAVVARHGHIRGLGIDAGTVGGVAERIWDQVFSTCERRLLEQVPPALRAQVSSLLFSAREAFNKCQFGVTGQWLEFRDVIVDLAGWGLGGGSFAIRPARRLRVFERLRAPAAGHFRVSDGTVVTAMALAGD